MVWSDSNAEMGLNSLLNYLVDSYWSQRPYLQPFCYHETTVYSSSCGENPYGRLLLLALGPSRMPYFDAQVSNRLAKENLYPMCQDHELCLRCRNSCKWNMSFLSIAIFWWSSALTSSCEKNTSTQSYTTLEWSVIFSTSTQLYTTLEWSAQALHTVGVSRVQGLLPHSHNIKTYQKFVLIHANEFT